LLSFAANNNNRSIRLNTSAKALGGAAAALLFGLYGARPAGASMDAAATAATDSSLEEIIVHARRRDEKLLDVPVAETVVTGQDITDTAAVAIEDALREIPNTLAFKSARSVSALEVTMRGQTAIPSAIVYDPAVGFYVDGVYVANGQGAMGTLLDVDSVEVVRGAQGTLFGRNNTGGSISLSTHRPELDQYSAELSASTGNQSQFGGRGILNLPLSDTFAVRFAYQNNQHQGWGSSIATGQTNFMNEHRDEYRIGALWKPTADFDAYLTYERFSADEVGALLHPLPGTVAAQIPGDVVPANFYQTDTGTPEHDGARVESWQMTLREHFSDALSAKLILGYRDLLAVNAYDADAEAVSIADVTLRNTSYQKSAELQLSGALGHLDWVGGLYWFRDNGSVPSDLAPQPFFMNPFPTLENNAVENQSKAEFLHGEYHLSSDWSLAAGLRHTEDTRSVEDDAYRDLSSIGGPPQFCTIEDGVTGLPFGDETGGPCPSIEKEVSYGYWSWEGSLRHSLSEDVSSYLRAGRSQRSGGWNLPLSTSLDQPYRPETLTDFELGLKSKLAEHGALNAAVYTGNYDDMQRLLATLVGGVPVTTVINAGRARVSGVELEGDLRLTQPLSMQATFGYTDARYLQFTDGFGNDVSNNKFYMTPKYTASLAGIYDVAMADGRLRLRSDFTWRDRVEFNVINDDNYSGPVGLLGARAAYTTRDGAWELAFYGSNLLDKQYAYNGGSILEGNVQIASWQAAADRRLYGVELTYLVSQRR
jgi:iron complex outermembrane receptor protein